MNLRRGILFLLDIIFITSLISIFFLLITGGYRIEVLKAGLVSCERPLVFLVASLLLRKFFYRKVSFKEGLIGRFLVFVEEYPVKRIKVFIFLTSLIFFAIVSSKIIPIWAPTGDEPHFLMITSSLLVDGDLNLKNNYDNEDYSKFYPGHLEPHAKIDQEGKVYSAHGAGLPVLVLPGYFLASRFGASYTIGILFSLLCVVLFSLCYQVTKNRIISICLSFLMSFTAPLVFYSYQIFTELPAALIVAYLFLFSLTAGKNHISLFKKILIGILLAYLPWLHVRYIIFVGVISIFLCYKIGLKRILPVLGIVISSIAILLIYMKVLYGVPSLIAQYCGIKAGISYLPKGILGNFLDCRFGLLLYSPYYIFLGAGLYFFCKNNKKQFLWWSLVVIPFFIAVSSYYHWHGGWCPPLRYITPVIPLFIIPLGCLVTSCRDKFFYILFLVFAWISFSAKNVLLKSPWLMYNSEYSSSRILDYLKLKGIDLGWLFPSLFESSTKDYIVIIGWLMFLILINYSIVQSSRRRRRFC